VRFHGDRARAEKVYADTRPLSAGDVADSIVWCASRPVWINIEDLLLMPTDQAAPVMVHRRPLTRAEAPAAPMAERWLNAWNAHDADAIVALYAPDARHTSARVRAFSGDGDTLTGTAAIGDYVRAGLARFPALRFEPVTVSSGPRTVAIEYRSHGVDEIRSTVELLELNDDGLIQHARVYHA
jgi:hypothetical protein